METHQSGGWLSWPAARAPRWMEGGGMAFRRAFSLEEHPAAFSVDLGGVVSAVYTPCSWRTRSHRVCGGPGPSSYGHRGYKWHMLVPGVRSQKIRLEMGALSELRAASWLLRQGREMPGEGPGPKPESGQAPGALDPSPGCLPSPCRSQGEVGASCILLLPWYSTGLPACSGAQTCTDTGALVRLVGSLLKQEAAVCARSCLCAPQ